MVVNMAEQLSHSGECELLQSKNMTVYGSRILGWHDEICNLSLDVERSIRW